jgi:virginiamycin B lyase
VSGRFRHLGRFALIAAVAGCFLVLAAPAGATSITEFPLLVAHSGPEGIAAGPDGNLWYAEYDGSRVGRITPTGTVGDWSNGSGISTDSRNVGIAAGPDGNLWFTENGGNRIGRFNPATKHADEFSTGITANANLGGIAYGSDGAMWFTELATNKIGRITTAGAVSEYSNSITASGRPDQIVAGPDGNLWFTEFSGRIGRITTSGTINEFTNGIGSTTLTGIAAGRDGSLWFTITSGNLIGRITTTGVVTEFPGLTPGSAPLGITAGPDGNIWFAESAGRIGRITPAGVVTEFPSGGGSNTEPWGITTGPDGNIWFTDYSSNSVGRVRLDPEVVTGGASEIAADGAKLSGTVNTLGTATTYVFQYGRTTSYGSATGSQSLAAGGTPAAVSARLGGLQPGTLYHYRVVAANARGTTNGPDRTFTTTTSGTSGSSPTVDRTAPNLVVERGTLLMTSGGRVLISITCPLSETLGCHGSVTLETAAKLRASSARVVKRRLRLGSAKFTIAAGQTRHVSVRISRRGRALLRKHSLRVRMTVVGTDAAGNSRKTVTRRILRAVKRVGR